MLFKKLKTRQVADELSATELYDLFHKYRSSQHPDKFIDEERKKEAEEKFKRLNSLLLELANIIEKEKLQSKPSEIIPFQKDYEIVKTIQQLINYEETINQFQLTNKVNEWEIKKLKNQIVKLQGTKADEKTTELITLYKPSKRSLWSQGISFLLTLTIGVLTKIEEVAVVLLKYFPFDPIYLNYIIFGILIFIPLRFLKSYSEEGQIEKTAKRIKTPLFIHKFLNYLIEKDIKDTFTEMNVFEFLSLELTPKNFISKFLKRYFYDFYTDTTIDGLKDIFIYNLLNKQLITISSAEQLDRKFKIVKTNHYSSPDFDFDDLD